MTLFLSSYTNKVDRKGRVSVPATFRAALVGQVFHGVVLFRSHIHICLEGFAYSRMEEIGARLEHFDLFSAAQDDLATAIFAESVQLPFDGDGRVVLPSDLVGFCDVADQAVFVGMGRKFQIWNPEKFEKRRAHARTSVREGGLTLPGERRGETQREEAA